MANYMLFSVIFLQSWIITCNSDDVAPIHIAVTCYVMGATSSELRAVIQLFQIIPLFHQYFPANEYYHGGHKRNRSRHGPTIIISDPSRKYPRAQNINIIFKARKASHCTDRRLPSREKGACRTQQDHSKSSLLATAP